MLMAHLLHHSTVPLISPISFQLGDTFKYIFPVKKFLKPQIFRQTFLAMGIMDHVNHP